MAVGHRFTNGSGPAWTETEVKILLVHQNFPGQLRGLAPALQRAGHQVRAISMRGEANLVGVENFSYRPRGNSAQVHPWLINTESAVLRGQAVAERVQRLAQEGWVPDVVLGHTGWGEMLFLRAALPHARLLGFNELYYQPAGGDLGFDPEFPADGDVAYRLLARNMHLAASLLACDVGITPTHWQAGCFPAGLRERITVIHDGLDTGRLAPNPSAWVRLSREGLKLRVGDELVTFINRNLEPLRGYHQFMRALPQILSQRPRAHVVIVGGDGVSYGSPPPAGQSYKKIYLDEVRSQLDMSRVHFVDRVPYEVLLQLLRVSAAHVYLTMPFVLSWSMLEAMSLGALVIGSDTAPVREFIEHGKNGVLVDFFSPTQIAGAVVDALAKPKAYAQIRAAARATMVEGYDFHRVTLPGYLALLRA